jgi:hypothetical protein
VIVDRKGWPNLLLIAKPGLVLVAGATASSH